MTAQCERVKLMNRGGHSEYLVPNTILRAHIDGTRNECNCGSFWDRETTLISQNSYDMSAEYMLGTIWFLLGSRENSDLKTSYEMSAEINVGQGVRQARP